MTNEYETLIQQFGYATTDGADGGGLVRGDALRKRDGATSGGIEERRFRYASVLDPDKLGVTDVFEINGAPCIYLKSLAADPDPEQLHAWHRTAWNHGLGRMLWIVTPTMIRVLNAFEPPPRSLKGKKHPAEILNCLTDDLDQLRQYELDRISVESGQFWATGPGKRISKSKRIDAQLVGDLRSAADILMERGCPHCRLIG
ncbi:MAG: hypothetical protein O2820_05105 [Planctomycetota bacterium]|nr:hypothetical protein [Planctomycetota bacterium]MDA1248582.1 hypothetical protein [Planctomycetota bacterium]